MRGWFDLVEVLATSDTQLDEIAAGIKSIRRDSPNPGVSVIVCGQVFADHPEFVGMVGADTMATDPLSSLAHQLGPGAAGPPAPRARARRDRRAGANSRAHPGSAQILAADDIGFGGRGHAGHELRSGPVIPDTSDSAQTSALKPPFLKGSDRTSAAEGLFLLWRL